jgi:hypothetical protein
VGDRDGDPALALLGRVVDRVNLILMTSNELRILIIYL